MLALNALILDNVTCVERHTLDGNLQTEKNRKVLCIHLIYREKTGLMQRVSHKW